MRRGAVAAAAAMSLLATGCGGSTEGTPQPSSEAAVALWNPCTEVTEAQLREVGVDPATRSSGILGVEEPGWKICDWNNANFNLGVYSTIYAIDEFKAKPENHSFQDVTVAGRTGVQYRMRSDEYDEGCDLVFAAEGGTVGLSISNRASSRNQADPCGRVRSAAEVIVPGFPS